MNDSIEVVCEGVYYIISALDNKLALDVEGGRICNGANIIVYKFDKNRESQMWRVERHMEDGTCSFVNMDTGKCIEDVEDNWSIHLWEYRASIQQKWKILEEARDDADRDHGVTF